MAWAYTEKTGPTLPAGSMVAIESPSCTSSSIYLGLNLKRVTYSDDYGVTEISVPDSNFAAQNRWGGVTNDSPPRNSYSPAIIMFGATNFNSVLVLDVSNSAFLPA